MTFLLILFALAGGALVFRWWIKRQTRKTLLAAPLKGAQQAVVAQHFPLYRKLPTALRDKLEGKINLFLHQIEFQGYDGLNVTEEMRLTIAAQACLLVVNKDSWYKNLRTILVYPGAFKSLQTESDGYVQTTREIVRTGESWARGPVVLSWAHAKHGAFIDDDGHNVVIHEFAHQLDDLSGDTDGAPILTNGQNPAEWARIFRDAYARLVKDVEAGRDTFLDPYGATAPAEFFAVAVESFFEKSEALKREEPELYQQLADYFGLEPVKWDRRIKMD